MHLTILSLTFKLERHVEIVPVVASKEVKQRPHGARQRAKSMVHIAEETLSNDREQI